MKTTKIKKITTEKKQTFDITIKNNHNFFCNGHLIHNCSYTGEVKVILFNVNNHEFVVNKGMKIAQAVLTSVVNGKWVNLVKKKDINKTDRADKGFGSTGI